MSVHLPRRCHFADSSQIANLKTTPLLGKLHNIVKFPIIQLQDADKQIISAVTDRAPNIMYFIVLRDQYPPWPPGLLPLAASCQTDGCALKFLFSHQRHYHTTDPWVMWHQVTWPAKRPRMLRCVNSCGEGLESATHWPRVWTLIF